MKNLITYVFSLLQASTYSFKGEFFVHIVHVCCDGWITFSFVDIGTSDD